MLSFEPRRGGLSEAHKGGLCKPLQDEPQLAVTSQTALLLCGELLIDGG